MSHSTHRGDSMAPLAGSATCPDNFGSPRELYFPRALSPASSATGVCHLASDQPTGKPMNQSNQAPLGERPSAVNNPSPLVGDAPFLL